MDLTKQKILEVAEYPNSSVQIIDSVITREPNVIDVIKWALQSITLEQASEVMIHELFQMVKVLTHYDRKFGKDIRLLNFNEIKYLGLTLNGTHLLIPFNTKVAGRNI